MSIHRECHPSLFGFLGLSDLSRAKVKFSSLTNLASTSKQEKRNKSSKNLLYRSKSIENGINDIIIELANKPSEAMCYIQKNVNENYPKLIQDRLLICKNANDLKEKALSDIEESHHTIRYLDDAGTNITSIQSLLERALFVQENINRLYIIFHK